MVDGTVHVIDDDDATRDSLRFLLASAGIAVQDHPSASAFLEKSEGREIGCVVTDIRMPDVSGMDLLKQLRASSPDVPVILITGHGDIALAVEAMKLGAADFLEKPFDDDALLATVRRAIDRRSENDVSSAERSEVSARIARLSPREKDVLIGLVSGKQNKAIANDLKISPRTVEVYRANLMMKMQAPNLSLLVRMALVAGIPGVDGVTQERPG
ncbi:MAG: response regulator FixJ [Alphaproteobacteria bacterium]